MSGRKTNSLFLLALPVVPRALGLASVGVLLLLSPSPAVAGPWQECSARFQHALQHDDVNGHVSRYLFKGRPANLLPGGTAPLMVTYEGCLRFCGKGLMRRDWDRIVEALLTWTLPLGGLLLQAPFESNRFWATFFMLTRWLGNPCVAIGSTLWSIRISGRCAALLNRWSVADAPPATNEVVTASDCIAEMNVNSKIAITVTAVVASCAKTCRTVAYMCHRVTQRVKRWLDDRDGMDEPQPAPLGGPTATSDLRDGLYILTVLHQFQLNDAYTDDVAAFVTFALFYSSPCTENCNDCAGVCNHVAGVARTDISPKELQPSATAGIAFAATTAITLAFWSSSVLASAAEIHVAAAELRRQRQELAETLRALRKHGVVPVMFSLLVFGVALAISIRQAYGQLGDDVTAHNLGLGLLMAWLPVLVSCTLLDRNPTNTAAARKALQTFFDSALRMWQCQPQGQSRSLPMMLVRPPSQAPHTPPPQAAHAPVVAAEPRIQAEPVPGLLHAARPPAMLLLPSQSSSPPAAVRNPRFVLAYSGQARRKWHYGVAHSVVARLEQMRGRPNSHELQRLPRCRRGCSNGLPRCCGLSDTDADAGHAQATGTEQRLRRQPQHGGIKPSLFDTVEAWQTLAALLVVGPATFGAFVVSYTTPPFGIGCRSGGHLVFIVLVSLAFVLDMLGGWLRQRYRQHGFVWRLSRRPGQTGASDCGSRSGGGGGAQKFRPRLDEPGSLKVLRVALTAVEVVASGWLLAIILAQTFGLYNTCSCKANLWGRRPGAGLRAVDFATHEYYRQHFRLRPYWVTGTVLGSVPLLGVLYAVAQWCAQSFLASVDYAKAMRGLRRVRGARNVLGGAGVLHVLAMLGRWAVRLPLALRRRARR